MKQKLIYIFSPLIFCVVFFTFANAATNTLLPPPDITPESREKNPQSCLYISKLISQKIQYTSTFEELPLNGKDIQRFIKDGRVVLDDKGNPKEWEGFSFGGPEHIAKRYVLCLLALGYSWSNGEANNKENEYKGEETLSDPELSDSLYAAGRVYRPYGVFKESARLLRKAVEIEEKISGRNGIRTGRRRAELAASLSDLGNYEEGIDVVLNLREVADQYSGIEKQFILLLFNVYSKELRKRNMNDEADSLESIANKIQ